MTEPNGFIYSFHFDKMRKKNTKKEKKIRGEKPITLMA